MNFKSSSQEQFQARFQGQFAQEERPQSLLANDNPRSWTDYSNPSENSLMNKYLPPKQETEINKNDVNQQGALLGIQGYNNLSLTNNAEQRNDLSNPNPGSVYPFIQGSQQYLPQIPISNSNPFGLDSQKVADKTVAFEYGSKQDKTPVFNNYNSSNSFQTTIETNQNSTNFPGQERSSYLNPNSQNIPPNFQQASPLNYSQRDEQQSDFGPSHLESSLFVSEPQEQQLVAKYRHILKSLDNSQISGVSTSQMKQPQFSQQYQDNSKIPVNNTDQRQYLPTIPEYEYSDSKNNVFSRQLQQSKQLQQEKENPLNEHQYFSAPSPQVKPYFYESNPPVLQPSQNQYSSVNNPVPEKTNVNFNSLPAVNPTIQINNQKDNYHPSNPPISQISNYLTNNNPPNQLATVPEKTTNFQVNKIATSKELLDNFFSNNKNDQQFTRPIQYNPPSLPQQAPQSSLTPLTSMVQNYKSLPSFLINTFSPLIPPPSKPQNVQDSQLNYQKENNLFPSQQLNSQGLLQYHSLPNNPQQPIQRIQNAQTDSQLTSIISPLQTESSDNRGYEYKSPQMKPINQPQLKENGLFIPTSISPIGTPERNKSKNITIPDQQQNALINLVPNQQKDSHRPHEISLPNRQSYFLFDGKANPNQKHINKNNSLQGQYCLTEQSFPSDSASRSSFASSRIRRKIFEGNNSSSKLRSHLVQNFNFTKNTLHTEPSIMSIPVQTPYLSYRPATGTNDNPPNSRPTYETTQVNKTLPSYSQPSLHAHQPQQIVNNTLIIPSNMYSSQRSSHSTSFRNPHPFTVIEQADIPILCIDCEKLFDRDEIETHKCINTNNQRPLAGKGLDGDDKIKKAGNNGIEDKPEHKINSKLEQVLQKVSDQPSCQEKETIIKLIVQALRDDTPTVELFNQSRALAGLCRTMDVPLNSQQMQLNKQQYPLQVLAERAEALIKDKIEVRLNTQDKNSSSLLNYNSNNNTFQPQNQQQQIRPTQQSNLSESRNQFFSPSHSFKLQPEQLNQQQGQQTSGKSLIKHNIFYSPPSKVFLPTYHAFVEKNKPKDNDYNKNNNNPSVQPPKITITPPPSYISQNNLGNGTSNQQGRDTARNEKKKLPFSLPARYCDVQEMYNKVQTQGDQEKDQLLFNKNYLNNYQK